MIKECRMCPRNCGAVRTENEGFGFCKMPCVPAVCRADLHFGEEPVISGEKGSGAIFFTGCVLRCSYCQNIEISRDYKGKISDAAELVRMMQSLENKGAQNINLVTPTHFADTVINALKMYKPRVPVVYNCGGYESVEVLKKLDGLIDIYLPDFKYSNSAVAQKYSLAPDYHVVAKKAITEMYRQVGDPVITDGKMKKGVLVRHLVIPANLQNSYGVIDEIYDIFGKNAYVSLMSQFTPNRQCTEKELNRRITSYEYEKVRDYMLERGMDRGFSQNRSSATAEMLPKWNFVLR